MNRGGRNDGFALLFVAGHRKGRLSEDRSQGNDLAAGTGFCMGRSEMLDTREHLAIRDFEQVGICLIPDVLPERHLAPLRGAIDECVARGPGNRTFGLPPLGDGGLDLRALLGDLACRLAGAPARLVRILAFDKTPSANWGVPWHQDRTVAVKRRETVDGFGPWSVKAGVPHVEPPQILLEAMFSLRLHLDDCGTDNGPLKIIPGSHLLGRLPVREVLDLGTRLPATTCTASAGDVLAMKALTVHASDAAAAPAHRRVLHLDFTIADLPAPLQWAVDADLPA